MLQTLWDDKEYVIDSVIYLVLLAKRATAYRNERLKNESSLVQ